MKTALVLSVVLTFALISFMIVRFDAGSDGAFSMSREIQSATPVAEISPETSLPSEAPSDGGDAEVGADNATAVPALDQLPADPTVSDLIPALPGLAGFELPRPLARRHPAELLSDEIEDFGWAAEMEQRIYTIIQDVSDGTFSQVEVQCRMTRCGLVVGLTSEGNRGVRHAIEGRLREVFDLRGTSRYGMSTPGGSQFVAIYFQVER